MSGLIVDVTGQTLVLLVILTGHFRYEHFENNIFHIVVALLYNAVMIFSLAFFAALFYNL